MMCGGRRSGRVREVELEPGWAIVAMVCAALAMSRGEGLAGAAVLVALVVLVLSFVLPTGVALNRL